MTESIRFQFAHPFVLTLLIVVGCWLVVRLRRRPPSMTFSLTSELAALAGTGRRLLGHLPLILRALSLSLIVLAAARPQLVNISKEVQSSGVDIMLCLDTSGSMGALDYQLEGKPVTRLDAVKKVVGEFIEKRALDRIGLVVFGEKAFTLCPLTVDKGLVLDLVNHMEIGMAGNLTAVGAALAIGGQRMKDLKAKSRILILLTDGRHNVGNVTPDEAAEAVRALGVKIYSIGVGGTKPAAFRVKTTFGSRLVYQSVDLDEASLQRVARIGKGRYFRAADSRRLAEIYEIIDRAEKSEIRTKEFFHFREIYLFFLIPALVLLGGEIFLGLTLMRVVP